MSRQVIMVTDEVAASFRDQYEWAGEPDCDFSCIVPMEGHLLCERVSPKARNPWATVLIPFGQVDDL